MHEFSDLIDNFEPLFNPRSIAVVGASNMPGKWGFIISLNIVLGGYKGELYFINPKEKLIHGLDSYPSLADVPDPIDLVFVTVPAALVERVIDDCAKKRVKNVVLISSGFSEVGPEGHKLEKRLVAQANQAGIRIIGPNTMGICSPPTDLHAIGSPIRPRAGHVAFLSQSGNLGVQILGWAESAGLGISRFVGSGNEANTSCDQVLEFYGADPLTKVIILYLEGVENGERFFEVAKKVTPHKPVIALKVGVTQAGAQAAASHSAAVSTSKRVWDAMVKQAGIIQAGSTEELIDLSRTFGHLPIPRGRRVGIMTLGGGWGVVTTDLCSREGLDLPHPSDATIEAIDQVLPPFWSKGNPVDLVGTMHRSAHFSVLEALCRDPNYDSIITLGSLTGMQFSQRSKGKHMLGALWRLLNRHGLNIFRFMRSMRQGLMRSMRESRAKDRGKAAKQGKSGGLDLREARSWGDDIFANEIKLLMRGSGKPIVPVAFDATAAPEIFKAFGLVAFGIPEKAVMALSKLTDYHKFLDRIQRNKLRQDLDAPTDIAVAVEWSMLKGKKGALSEHQGKKVLEQYAINCTKEELARDAKEAVVVAENIGYPVVMKVDSPDIGHKTDADAVRIGLESADQVREAFKEIIANSKAYKPRADIRGVLVQEMVTGGTEVIVGISRDPNFGPTIMFGLGGIFVEALEDVALRILPIDRSDAEEMVREIKGRKILEGFRGSPPADIDSLVETITRIGELAWVLRHRILEMDINPLMVFEQGKGVKVMDTLVVLADEQKKPT